MVNTSVFQTDDAGSIPVIPSKGRIFPSFKQVRRSWRAEAVCKTVVNSEWVRIPPPVLFQALIV